MESLLPDSDPIPANVQVFCRNEVDPLPMALITAPQDDGNPGTRRSLTEPSAADSLMVQSLAQQLTDSATSSSEGLANFVHAMRIMFDEVPGLLRPLFRQRWDDAYPANAWDDTPASGRLMWNGSHFCVAVAGAWPGGGAAARRGQRSRRRPCARPVANGRDDPRRRGGGESGLHNHEGGANPSAADGTQTAFSVSLARSMRR
jgi:hypothetical protein